MSKRVFKNKRGYSKIGKNIVLDLDMTLIHTFTDMSSLAELDIYSNFQNRDLADRIYVIELHDVLDEPGEGVYSRMWGVYRPGWSRFRRFLRRHFNNVIIWSAGQPKYVDAMVNVLFPDPDFQPLRIYTWEDCVIDDSGIYKPLAKIVEDLATHGVTLENLLALDDREDTFSLNVNNGIKISEYKPPPTELGIRAPDLRLLELERWLKSEAVASSQDLRLTAKDAIFGTA
jgi:TFIIF-interacting CTD phosphatase-like protein